jgi:hypothetical protein
MPLCLGKITKQSQTTECSIFSRCFTYVVVAMEPAGRTRDARYARMALDSEESDSARAWQERHFSGPLSRTWRSSDRGWSQWPTEADAQILRQV